MLFLNIINLILSPTGICSKLLESVGSSRSRTNEIESVMQLRHLQSVSILSGSGNRKLFSQKMNKKEIGKFR